MQSPAWVPSYRIKFILIEDARRQTFLLWNFQLVYMDISFHMILGFLDYSALLCIETEYDTIA